LASAPLKYPTPVGFGLIGLGAPTDTAGLIALGMNVGASGRSLDPVDA